MRIADGSLQTTYDGGIKLNTVDIIGGPGLVVYPSQIAVDPTIIDLLGIQIIKEELQKVTLDLDKINRLLEGTKEDKQIAYTLLENESNYIVPIHRALVMNDQWTIMQEIRKYRQNNLKLSKEIL